jgi:hypothetical protein
MDTETLSTATSSAPTRSCGSCTMCCKVYDVPPIDNKPRGVWCKHCKPGRGCGIWESRPEFCKDFHCQWIKDDSFGPEWKPDTAKFVMNFRETLGILAVMVDANNPGSWRREPYYSRLKMIARNMAQQKLIVQIITLKSIIVLGTEKEFAIGEWGGDLKLSWQTHNTPRGVECELVGVAKLEPAVAA